MKGQQQPVALGAAVELFLMVDRSPITTKSYRSKLQLMTTAIGPSRSVRTITFEELAAYAQSRKASGLRSSTLFEYVRVVRQFFEWAVHRRLVDESPARDLHVRKGRRERKQRAAPDSDLQKMLDQVRQDKPHPAIRNEAILLFLMDTACRVGGLVSLQLKNLDLDERKATLYEKGGRWVPVYFGARTTAAIRRWLDIRARCTHDYVWTTTGRAAEPLGRSGVQTMVALTAERAGLSMAWRPHAIRHAVAHTWSRQGVPVTVLRDKLNHTNVRTTLENYYVEGDEYVRAYSDRLSLAMLDTPLAAIETSAEKPPAPGKVLRFADYAG